MKKKILLTIALISMFIFAFVIAVSAETPAQYIEFGARFPGSDEYITVYTQNAESAGNPQINFASYKFYSDVEFTEEVDMSTATGIDFSVAKTHGCNGKAPNRMKKPASPFVNCVEVKWFLEGFPTVSYENQFFKGWTGLKSFDFGNATAINDNTFEGCGLEEITIPATIKSFGNSSFKDCKSLKSVTFEGSLNKIGSGAFYGCSALTDVKIDNLTFIGASMFEKCTSLTSVAIPSGVTSIGNSAFYNCTSLVSVDISNGVTSIGSSAFRSTALTTVTIPSGVESVGNEAFRQCPSLTTVIFEGDSTALGTSMFLGSQALESVTFPKNLEKIPSSMFWGCGKVVITNLSELKNLTTIGSSAFQDAMTLVFTLPDTVTTIEKGAFQSAFKNGGSLTINPTSKLQIIGEDAFRDCRTLPSIYIPSTVTSIGPNAFRQAYVLSSLENFENCQITELGVDTFSYSGVQSLKLPETLTTIGAAFYDTEKLALVYIPSSVTSIADTFTGKQPANAMYIYTGKNEDVLASCARVAGANVIDGNDYDPTITYTGINLVVGYSHCVVYNDGVHGDTELTALLESYYEAIDVVSKCKICETTKVVHQIPALFTYRGYSVAEEGASGIDISFKVNRDAVATYEGVTGEKLTYGIFAGLKDTIGANDIFGSDGKALTGVVTADMTDTDYSIFAIKMVGFSEAQMETVFAMGAYVSATKDITTDYTYLQISTPKDSEKYYFASYIDVLKLKNGN